MLAVNNATNAREIFDSLDVSTTMRLRPMQLPLARARVLELGTLLVDTWCFSSLALALLHDSLRWAVTAQVVDLPLLRHLVTVEFSGRTLDQTSIQKRPDTLACSWQHFVLYICAFHDVRFHVCMTDQDLQSSNYCSFG